MINCRIDMYRFRLRFYMLPGSTDHLQVIGWVGCVRCSVSRFLWRGFRVEILSSILNILHATLYV